MNESSLVGIYHAETSCLAITLIVKADHSFVQSVRMKDGGAKQLSGNWSVERGGKWLVLKPFLDFTTNTQGTEAKSISLPPEAIGPVIEMGPVIIKCPDTTHEVNYSK